MGKPGGKSADGACKESSDSVFRKKNDRDLPSGTGLEASCFPEASGDSSIKSPGLVLCGVSGRGVHALAQPQGQGDLRHEGIKPHRGSTLFRLLEVDRFGNGCLSNNERKEKQRKCKKGKASPEGETSTKGRASDPERKDIFDPEATKCAHYEDLGDHYARETLQKTENGAAGTASADLQEEEEGRMARSRHRRCGGGGQNLRKKKLTKQSDARWHVLERVKKGHTARVGSHVKKTLLRMPIKLCMERREMRSQS